MENSDPHSKDNDAGLSPSHRKIIASVSMASFMCLLDSFIVNISLPTIGSDFSATPDEVIRISLAFLLLLTSGMPVWGKLADRIGLKKIFISGYVLFICSSLACGLAPSLWFLVFSRGIQGLGAAMLISAGPAFIARYIPRQHQGQGFGIQATSGAVGLILGAPLGGLITNYLGWHYIFLINIPIGLTALYLAWHGLPGDVPSPEKTKQPFDLQGAVLIFLGLGLLVIGLNSGSSKGWTSLPVFASLLTGAAVLCWLFFHEQKSDDPLLPLTVFSKPTFVLMTLAYSAALMTLSCNNFVMPFYLTQEVQLSPAHAGFVMFAFSASYGLISLSMGKRADTTEPALLCSWGMATVAVSCLLFTILLSQPAVIISLLFLVCFGCGFGTFIAPATKLVMAETDVANAGSVSALFRTSGNIASLMGISLASALLAPPGQQIPLTGFHRVYTVSIFIPLIALALSIGTYRWTRSRSCTKTD